MASSKWFNCKSPRPEAKCRLICFPWCGGGTQFFTRWGVDFPAAIEVVGVILPNRETRRTEKMPDNLSELVSILGEEIVRVYGRKPFAFFGHSMGVILTFEVARYIRQKHCLEPTHVFFSSSFAPHSEERKRENNEHKTAPIHTWKDEKLIARITKHGGTPKMIADDKEFMKRLVLPPYRADLKMVHGYLYQMEAERPLSCAVMAFGGSSDVDHRSDEFAELTTGSLQTKSFSGGHFYLLKEDNYTFMRNRIAGALS